MSLRLIKEMHAELLSKGRGASQTPGEFRRTQNWIGGTRPGNAAFGPPPAEQVLDCMGRLELFLHDQPEPTPALLKAALAHVQFETIHPFLDGNGRLGRLLITLLLCEQKILREPMLYLSLYFKTHRQYYYELLNEVRLSGDWEAWLDFFAEAVIATTTQAVDTAQQLVNLASEDRDRISDLGASGAFRDCTGIDLSQAKPGFQLRRISGNHEPGDGADRLRTPGFFISTHHKYGMGNW